MVFIVCVVEIDGLGSVVEPLSPNPVGRVDPEKDLRDRSRLARLADPPVSDSTLCICGNSATKSDAGSLAISSAKFFAKTIIKRKEMPISCLDYFVFFYN